MTTAILLPVSRAARALGVLDFHVREVLRRNPDLPTVRVGRCTAIDPADLPALRAALVAAGFLQETQPC